MSPGWLHRQLREIGANQQPTEQLFESFEQFCGLLTLRLKSAGANGSYTKLFRYDDWHEEQQRFNRERSGRDIVLKPRQVGFSTLELARDLYFAITRTGVNVLVVVHDAEIAGQLFLTLKHFAESLQSVRKLPETIYSNKRELVFAMGSAVRIVEAGTTTTAAEKKGRSGTVHRLHATEVAFWGAASETMGAILGCVPSDGEVVIESTANGIGNLFYADVMAAREQRNGMTLHFFPWWQHAEYRIEPPADFNPATRCSANGKPDQWESRLRALGCDDGQIAWWRSKVDDPKFGLERALQEFPIDLDTCFRAAGAAWFDASVLDRISALVREPLRLLPIKIGELAFEPARIYVEPELGADYVLFGDVSEGVANDGSAATVLNRRTKAVVATWWSNTVAPGDFGAVMAALGFFYNRALLGVERNNHGHAAIERLTAGLPDIKCYPNLYTGPDERVGWVTNTASRAIMWDELATAIRDGSAYTPDAATLSECRSLIRDTDGKPRARGKSTRSKDASRDDRFVAWAGAWQIAVPTTVVRDPAPLPGSRWDGMPGKGF